MNKNTKVAILVVGIVAVIVAFFTFNSIRNDESDNLSQNEKSTQDDSTEQTDIDREQNQQDKDENNEVEDMVAYDLQAILEDVTSGDTVRGINTGGLSSGIANAAIAENKYVMEANFTALPNPVGTDFYEGWLVRTEPFDFISTGKLTNVDGDYVDNFQSETDYSDYDQYVLTLEPDDGDPAPADHIVEGFFKKL
jgi:hypothetical protein